MDTMIVRTNLADQVYDHIKGMILSGELRGGERIPEAVLCRMFGVSRTPMREALKKLSEYGLILLKPRSYSEVITISEQEAQETAEVRLNLEIMAARLFSENASEEDFVEIENIAERCQTAVDNNDKALTFIEDSRFHLKIVELCRNSVLSSLYDKIEARIQLYRINQCQDIETIRTYVKQHKLLVSAMRKKELRLLSGMLTKHILRTGEYQ